MGFSPFALVNGDILTDYDFGQPARGVWEGERWREGRVGWYWFRIRRSIWGGIFRLWMAAGAIGAIGGGNSLTYSGVGVFSPQMFSDLRAGDSAGLGPLLFSAAELGRDGL